MFYVQGASLLRECRDRLAKWLSERAGTLGPTFFAAVVAFDRQQDDPRCFDLRELLQHSQVFSETLRGSRYKEFRKNLRDVLSDMRTSAGICSELGIDSLCGLWRDKGYTDSRDVVLPTGHRVHHASVLAALIRLWMEENSHECRAWLRDLYGCLAEDIMTYVGRYFQKKLAITDSRALSACSLRVKWSKRQGRPQLEVKFREGAIQVHGVPEQASINAQSALDIRTRRGSSQEQRRAKEAIADIEQAHGLHPRQVSAREDSRSKQPVRTTQPSSYSKRSAHTSTQQPVNMSRRPQIVQGHTITIVLPAEVTAQTGRQIDPVETLSQERGSTDTLETAVQSQREIDPVQTPYQAQECSEPAETAIELHKSVDLIDTTIQTHELTHTSETTVHEQDTAANLMEPVAQIQDGMDLVETAIHTQHLVDRVAIPVRAQEPTTVIEAAVQEQEATANLIEAATRAQDWLDYMETTDQIHHPLDTIEEEYPLVPELQTSHAGNGGMSGMSVKEKRKRARDSMGGPPESKKGHMAGASGRRMPEEYLVLPGLQPFQANVGLFRLSAVEKRKRARDSYGGLPGSKGNTTGPSGRRT